MWLFFRKINAEVIPRSRWYEFKQELPVRCTICFSKKQPHGKVIDGKSTRWKDLDFFLGQHSRDGQTHLKNVARALDAQAESRVDPNTDGPSAATADCQGIRLGHESCGNLMGWEHHFKRWFACRDASSSKHQFSDQSGEMEIKHHNCLKVADVVPGQRPVCANCRSLQNKDNLYDRVRMHAVKKFAAELLYKRIFESEDAVKELVQQLKADILYHRSSKRMDVILEYKNWQLQNYVRNSFHSIRHDCKSENLQLFLDSVVNPALDVNLTNAESNKHQIVRCQESLQRFLKDPNTEDQEYVQAQVAKAVLSGKLSQNPMVMGLVLGCLRSTERDDQGKDHRGRNAKDSVAHLPLSQQLTRDAGVTLALHCNSTAVLGNFGLSKYHWQMGDFTTKLLKASLPVPFLSIRSPEALQENVLLLDQRMSALTGTTGCSLDNLADVRKILLNVVRFWKYTHVYTENHISRSSHFSPYLSIYD